MIKLNKGMWASLTLVATISAAAPAHAETPPIAAGFRVGTLGIGAEGTIGVNDYINVRVPFNLFSYSDSRNEDGIDYDGKLKLQSFGAQVDVHPFKGSFFLSAGLFANGNKLKLHASDPTGEEEYDIGDATYVSDTSDPLDLNARMKFNSVAPYAGLGWGNPILGDRNLYFRLEIGAYFQGAGKIDMKATGSAKNQDDDSASFKVDGDTPEAMLFQANLEQERSDLEGDIKDFKIYPAISLAIGYRFKL
ncbi:hypothetical protein [Hydrocarboniphaga sp.]|uniref:hypothetical protein n=1 Tax=Hydrocarboniphaga sp. TaxID=2033016 RepID=UPI003D0B00FB